MDLEEYNNLSSTEERDQVFRVMIADYEAPGYKTAEEVKNAFYHAVTFVKFANQKDSQGYYQAAGERVGIPGGAETGSLSVLDEVSQKARKAVFSAVNGKIQAASGEKETAELFRQNTLYTVIANAEHYNDVKRVLNAYVDAGLIKTDKDMSADVYKDLMSKRFNSGKELLTAIENAKSKQGTTPPAGGGSGGSGGGGSTGGSVGGVAPPSQTGGQGSEPIQTSDGTLGGKMSFSDMEDAKWALSQVETMCEKGIIVGVGGGLFQPHRYVSREELSKMLCLLGGFLIETADIPFTDVNKDSWAYPYICTAYKNGLIRGVSDTEFAPKAQVTREQAAVMLHRMIEESVAGDAGAFRFDDDASIAPWAKNAVYTLRENGIVNGRTQKTFCPVEPMTRVEAAVLLCSAGTKAIWNKEES